VATLAGAANYREIGSHAADMPQELLKKLGAKWSWFKLRQAAFVRREVFEISGDRISKENALIITGGKPGEMTAADVNLHVRKHWGIENKSHYIRDTIYRGDHGQAWPAKDRKSSRLSAASWRG
jgi:hypothetical protein